MSERFKNPYFYVGVVGTILAAMGISADMLTSWGTLGQALIDLFSNPFMIGSVAMALLGVFVNPTTPGLTDGVVEAELETEAFDTEIVEEEIVEEEETVG